MTVEVFQDTNFEEGWKDSAVPNMSFNYDQSSIDECEFSEGRYWATYEPMVLIESHTFIYLTPTGRETITVPPGTYGVKPEE
jgi:hypothetical protein